MCFIFYNNEKEGEIMIKQIKIFILSVVVLFVVFYIIQLYQIPIRDSVKIEAGKKDISISSFLKNKDMKASLITPITSHQLSTVGQYDIVIHINGKEYQTQLMVEDTIPPQVQLKQLKVYQGHPVEPQMFIKRIKDETTVSYSFEKTVDIYKLGKQAVTIIVEDEGHNQTKKSTTLEIMKENSPK